MPKVTNKKENTMTIYPNPMARVKLEKRFFTPKGYFIDKIVVYHKKKGGG